MTPPVAPPAGTPRPRKQTLQAVWSPQLRNRRDVDVYLPASYDSGRRRYPVIYMQDGQNLSDPAIAFAGTWRLDEVLRDLAVEAVDPIVVGVHNTDARLTEYSPFPDRRHGGGGADAYLAFLVDTVKPRIDRLFRTKRSQYETAIVGSSMGGLLSLYAFLKRPDVFQLAGVMSPSLWFGRDALFDYIEKTAVKDGRIYVDVGTAEGAGTLRDARLLVSMLKAKGLEDEETIEFVEARGGRHEEEAWARRLKGALEFLFE